MADQSDKSAELDRLLAESKQLFARVEQYLRDLKKAKSTSELINDFFDNKWEDVHRVADEIFEVKTRAEQQREQLDAVKAAADAKLEEINSVKQAVDQQLATINTVKDAADQQLAAINTVKDAVDQQLVATNSVKDTVDQQLTEINTVKDVADQQLNKIKSAKQTADQQLAAIKSNKAKIDEQSADISQLQKDAHAAADDIQKKQKNIADFNTALFGDGENEDEENPCIKQKFQNLYDETEKNYGDLTTRIEGLLPGATATGLASSFKDAKEENVVNKWLNRGFYCPILFLAAVYIGLYGYVLFTDASVTWELLVFKTTLSFPFAWMAWYCQKAIAETKKTREEYHHKQRVMELYAGFADHIQGLSADDRMSALAQVVLDTVKRNPAEQVKTESDDQLINRFTKIISAVKDIK